MSTPAGQSDEQPLQDRHRSSEAASSAEPKPLDQRAVRELLQHPGAAAGGVLLVPGGQEGRAHHPPAAGGVGAALADADAAVHRHRQVAVVVGIGEAEPGAQRAGLRHPQVRVDRPRVDHHARIEQVARVEHRLDRGHGVDGLG